MGDRTGIQWTDATWNPMTGCTEISAGCDHCYAATMARTRLHSIYLQKPSIRSNGEPDAFAPRFWEERLNLPRSWKTPRRVFVNSMSDLFHAHFALEMIQRVFAVMTECPQHVFQVLTKRPERALRLAHKLPWPENLWMGATVESRAQVSRIEVLREIPASIRFISAEPLIGPLGKLDLTNIHWVIGGGESGPGYRPVKLAWARALRDQVIRSNVSFYWKQWGGPTPKSGGRLLDGIEWNGFPTPHPAEHFKAKRSVL